MELYPERPRWRDAGARRTEDWEGMTDVAFVGQIPAKGRNGPSPVDRPQRDASVEDLRRIARIHNQLARLVVDAAGMRVLRPQGKSSAPA